MSGKEIWKRAQLPFFIFVPVLIGILFYFLSGFSAIQMILYYSGYIPLVCFWCYAGTKFAQKYQSLWKTAFAANGLILVLFCFYLIQFFFVPPEKQSMALAAASQVVTLPIKTFLLQFLYTANGTGAPVPPSLQLGAECVSVLVLFVIFAYGFFGRKRAGRPRMVQAAESSTGLNRAARRKNQKR